MASTLPTNKPNQLLCDECKEVIPQGTSYFAAKHKNLHISCSHDVAYQEFGIKPSTGNQQQGSTIC